MKTLVTIIISMLILGCATTQQKELAQHKAREGLLASYSQFLNQVEREQALQSLEPSSVVSLTERAEAHTYFQCSGQHDEQGGVADNLISFEFEEMDIRDVMVELSIMTGVSILMDDSVEGIVSASFEEVPIAKAIATLLSIGEYDYRIHESHVFIGSTDPTYSSYHQLSTTCIYRPNNMDAISLATLLPEYYQRFVKLNKQNGYIAITATNSMMQRIQKDVVLFDAPQKQVVMELSVVEVSVEALEILGLDWKGAQDKASHVFSKSLASSSYGRTVSLPTLQAKHFLDAVNLLKQSGDAEMKTMPSIVVLEGKEAKFKSMKTTWTPEIMSGSHKKEPIYYGVNLNVVPFVSDNGTVRLNIKNATVSDFVRDSQGLPRVVEHSISSSVSIRDGESLIIGGLLQKKRIKDKTGIPGLGDTPLIGRLFSTTSDLLEETEVLIILKPKIIRG